MTRETVEVLGCRIDALTMDDTLGRCEELIRSAVGAHQLSVNVAKLVALTNDARLRAIVADADVVSADGQPVVWASRLLGVPLPERIAGIDLMHRLLAVASEKGYRVFVLGARSEVLETAAQRLRETHPKLQLVGYRHGWFTDDESDAVCAQIRDARPHILFVAMSSPRKEYWIADHRHELGVPLSMGVGGAIDVIAGVSRRAPLWMQRAGLEWFYRLVQEPRRLGSRYLSTNAKFVLLLAHALVRRQRG